MSIIFLLLLLSFIFCAWVVHLLHLLSWFCLLMETQEVAAACRSARKRGKDLASLVGREFFEEARNVAVKIASKTIATQARRSSQKGALPAEVLRRPVSEALLESYLDLLKHTQAVSEPRGGTGNKGGSDDWSSTSGSCEGSEDSWSSDSEEAGVLQQHSTNSAESARTDEKNHHDDISAGQMPSTAPRIRMGQVPRTDVKTTRRDNWPAIGPKASATLQEQLHWTERRLQNMDRERENASRIP